jgi:hypothetical protein
VTWECEREQDVLDAAATGRWPDRADGDLRAHVASCAICADVAEIAPLLIEDRDAAWEEAAVPPPGAVWWRSQLRVRREAAEQAARPVVLVQRAALVYAGMTLFALGVLLGPWVRAWAQLTADLLPWLIPSQETLAALAAAASAHTLPIVAVTLCLLIAPVFLWFASADR